MGRKGRPQKPGKRNGNRASRAGVVLPFDKGSEKVQAMRARFGEYYSSAIGRAYAAGLLDHPTDESRAKVRLDSARKFVSLYGAVIGRDRYRCPLNQSPRAGHVEYIPNERDIDDQQWLIANMERIDRTGCRPFFDQLTGRQFTDYGPPWLDALLAAKPHDRRDTMILDAALKALDAIGPVHSKPQSLTLPQVKLVCGGN